MPQAVLACLQGELVERIGDRRIARVVLCLQYRVVNGFGGEPAGVVHHFGAGLA
jgi:hypothetical protein